MFHWSEDCAVAFEQHRTALVGDPILSYPDPQLPLIVDNDASNVGLGAVLSQEGENGEQVIAYYSRSLNRPERNYCVTRRELPAVVLGLRHFRPYLYGRRFLLRTDHASLTWLLNFKEPEGQPLQLLHYTLQDYHFKIRHRSGRLHANADALSRRPCEVKQCRYCQRVEDRDTVNPTVSALQPVSMEYETGPQIPTPTAAGNDGVEPIDPQ